jgi:site-specific recombinase XerD
MRKAGIKGGWHHFRHTFITHTLRAGADLETTRALSGHGSVSTTSRYLHSSPGHMTAAVNRLPFKTPIKIPIKKKTA